MVAHFHTVTMTVGPCSCDHDGAVYQADDTFKYC